MDFGSEGWEFKSFQVCQSALMAMFDDELPIAVLRSSGSLRVNDLLIVQLHRGWPPTVGWVLSADRTRQK
jgi:hypothetical protein